MRDYRALNVSDDAHRVTDRKFETVVLLHVVPAYPRNCRGFHRQAPIHMFAHIAWDCHYI